MFDTMKFEEVKEIEKKEIKKYQNKVRREFLLTKQVITAQNNPENIENQDNIEKAFKIFGCFLTGGVKKVQEYIDSKDAMKSAKESFWKDMNSMIDSYLDRYEKLLIEFKSSTISAIIETELFNDVLNDPNKTSKDGKPMIE